jgi:hypothetical protein
MGYKMDIMSINDSEGIAMSRSSRRSSITTYHSNRVDITCSLSKALVKGTRQTQGESNNRGSIYSNNCKIIQPKMTEKLTKYY